MVKCIARVATGSITASNMKQDTYPVLNEPPIRDAPRGLFVSRFLLNFSDGESVYVIPASSESSDMYREQVCGRSKDGREHDISKGGQALCILANRPRREAILGPCISV
jgi:hypothetical protein